MQAEGNKVVGAERREGGERRVRRAVGLRAAPPKCIGFEDAALRYIAVPQPVLVTVILINSVTDPRQ